MPILAVGSPPGAVTRSATALVPPGAVACSRSAPLVGRPAPGLAAHPPVPAYLPHAWLGGVISGIRQAAAAAATSSAVALYWSGSRTR